MTQGRGNAEDASVARGYATTSEAAVDSAPADGFPIVGIGASAGGLAALQKLLSHLPEHSGMAFAVVQHLEPAHCSELAALLTQATALPVLEVQDGMAVLPGHVYVIPPNVYMELIPGKWQLTPRGERGRVYLPVDVLFRSMAKERKERAIGVVLSGAGSDGSLGLAEIKAVGGITFAQDEDSAEFAAMPLSAVANGCVDSVLPPERIAQELARVGEHDYLRTGLSAEADAGVEECYGKVLAQLRAVSGVDFSDYRETTIKRRIARRMALHQLDSLSAYLEFLNTHQAEGESLYRDVLINVTSFFRDPAMFDALKTTVFPKILESKSEEMPIRIWVPGCSSGQEVYSLAMALVEFLDQHDKRPPVQIFGTDVNDLAAVEKARPGVYPPSIASEVSPERLQRFFVKSEGGYRVSKAIRDMCIFARHDLAADPPFSKLDLISCRNLLIYLSRPLQQRIIPAFHYALNSSGFLVLGPSETVGRLAELFETVDRKNNIYARSAVLATPYPYHLPAGQTSRLLAAGVPVDRTPALMDLRREADRLIMARFAPASVLIDENMEILQFRGRTSPYLEAPVGQPTHNLLKMARDQLFLELRAAIDEARKHNNTVRREQVRIHDDGGLRIIDLEVIPVRLPGFTQRCFLVLFVETSATGAVATPPALAAAAAQLNGVCQDSRGNAALREELASVKEYLQSIIEQQSAANEELQSANEEVRSANEELQSTNEELQTAKEELQSTNEELRTVNDELQARNHETTRLSDDLNNTLASIKLPLVMLGPDLRIRRFTSAAATLLDLGPTDLGRPLAEVSLNLQVQDLTTVLLEVIATVRVAERELQDRNGRWYRLVMHPYCGGDGRIDGVVLVWHNIDESKRVLLQLQQAKDSAETVGRAKDQFLAMLSHELRTPLTPVLAAVSMLKEHAADTEAKDAVDMIQRNVELQARLIDDLLDVTRIERGKIELAREAVELRHVLERAIEVCRPDLQARDLQLRVDWGAVTWWVDADVSRLQQVFWNLIKNAIKFTPHGGTIAVTCQPRNGGVQVEVTDNGIGIDPEMLPRLFDSFTQAERSITQRFGGLGLGLTISRALVELHGGTIEAHSEGRGKGATFRVWLPQVAASEPVEAAETLPPAAVKQRRLRVLLVEDHADTAQVMARLLVHAGHEVHTAGDVASAMQLATHAPFDLLLSDLGLPDGSGLDLMKELRQRGNQIPGIALSGFGQEDDLRQSREVGYVQHLIKPVSVQRLLAAVQEVGCG